MEVAGFLSNPDKINLLSSTLKHTIGVFQLDFQERQNRHIGDDNSTINWWLALKHCLLKVKHSRGIVN